MQLHGIHEKNRKNRAINLKTSKFGQNRGLFFRFYPSPQVRIFHFMQGKWKKSQISHTISDIYLKSGTEFFFEISHHFIHCLPGGMPSFIYKVQRQYRMRFARQRV